MGRLVDDPDFLAAQGLALEAADMRAMLSNPITLGLVGDSRNVVFNTSGVNLYKSSSQLATWLEFFSYGRIKLSAAHSFAAGGTQVSAIPGQMDSLLAVTPRCGAVLIVTGTNTFNAGGTAADAWTILAAQITRALMARVRPIVVLDLPRQQSTFSPGASAALQSCRFNSLIRANAPALGALVVDLTAVLADAASATGDPISGYYSDGIHLAPKGAFVAGKEIAAYFAAYPKAARGFASPRDTYDASNNPSGNLFGYGLMQGSSGSNAGTGASGTVPTGWKNSVNGGTGTSVASVEARADGGPGNWLKLDIAGSDAIDVRAQLAANITAGFSTGDVVALECEMSVTGGVNVNASRCALVCYGSGFVIKASGQIDALTTTQLLPDGSFSGLWRTPSIVVTSDTINLTPTFYFATGNAGGALTARLGAVSIRKVV